MPKSRGGSGDMRLLAKLLRNQAAFRVAQQRSFQLRLADRIRDDPKWIMSAEERRELAEIDTFSIQGGGSMIRIAEGMGKANSALSTEQLEAQLKQEMLRVAITFTAEDWAVLDKARAQQAKQKASAS